MDNSTRNRIITATFMVIAVGPIAFAQSGDIIRINGNTVELNRVSPSALNTLETRHAILTFSGPLAGQEREKLAGAGLRVLHHVGGDSYIVAAKESISVAAQDREHVRILAAAAVRPEWKISGAAHRTGAAERWRNANKEIKALLSCYEDVSESEAREIFRRKGVRILDGEFRTPHGFTVLAPWRNIAAALRHDSVRVVEPYHPLPEIDVEWAAARSRVPEARNTERHGMIDGTGVKVGIWDSSAIFDHVDLAGQITNAFEGYYKSVSLHTTHVAGIIAASGEITGIAPGAHLISYDFLGDVVSEVRQAIDKYGIRITNNSWGLPDGWRLGRTPWPINNILTFGLWQGGEIFGYYGTVAEAYDQLVLDTDILGVFSAGNNRSTGFLGPHLHMDVDGAPTDVIYHDIHSSNPEFGAITGFNLAKNVITVGATFDDDMLTHFSSAGFVSGGRLKPDVVANGYSVYSTIPNNDYMRLNGTSMSGPVVAGILSLILEAYDETFDKKIKGDLAKAILIHGARDLGRPGPDYFYGFGMADAEYSLDLIFAAAGEGGRAANFFSKKVKNNRKKQFNFNVPGGADELRITLLWHDAPGPGIVNDLDLTVIDPRGNIYLPFVLDPNNPTRPAKTGRNSLDNTEQIRLARPAAGAWRIIVRGESVPLGPQYFVVVASAGDLNRAPATPKGGAFGDADIYLTNAEGGDSPEEKDSFSKGDTYGVFVSAKIAKNSTIATDKSSVGSVYFQIRFLDADGSEYFRISGGSDDPDKIRSGKLLHTHIGDEDDFALVFPNSMQAGTYTAEVEFFMFNGAKKTARREFTLK